MNQKAGGVEFVVFATSYVTSDPNDGTDNPPHFDQEKALEFARSKARKGVEAVVYKRFKTVRPVVEEV